METWKEEYEERTRIKEWDGEKKGRIREKGKDKKNEMEKKKGRIRGKDKDKKNEMEKRKEEYEERTRIKRMGWRKERENTRKGQGEEEKALKKKNAV